MKPSRLFNTFVACATLGLAGTSTFAADKLTAERDINWQIHVASEKTRAQVVNQLKEASMQNQLVRDGSFEYAYPHVSAGKADRTAVQFGAEGTAANIAGRDIAADIYFGG